MSEVIESIMLIKVDGNDNNNKFYEVKLMNDGDVSTRWGRVGASGTTKILTGGKSVYDSTVRKKKSRGYKDSGIEVSTNVVSKSLDKEQLKKIALSNMASQGTSSNLSSALSFLAQENRHQIIETSGGQIKADTDGLMKTPLGILSRKNISDAEKVLDRIEKKVLNPRSRIADPIEVLTTEYFTLVPHKLSGRSWAKDYFTDVKDITEEREFLRQLRTSSDLYDSRIKAANSDTSNVDDSDVYNDVFNVHLKEADNEIFNKLNKLFTSTVDRNHSSKHLKMKTVYTIDNPDAKNKEFDEISSSLGNVTQLWHGSSSGNILSILREGLYCPPLNAKNFQTSGRMVGDGIYLADVSTKALNYSQGYWHGSRNNRCFMFLVEAVMGNVFYPHKHPRGLTATRSYQGFDRNEYNSIHAKAGRFPDGNNLRNDEMVIWNSKQIKLTHLVEFTL